MINDKHDVPKTASSREISQAPERGAQGPRRRKCGWAADRQGHVVQVEGHLGPISAPPHCRTQEVRVDAHTHMHHNTEKGACTHMSRHAHAHTTIEKKKKRIPAQGSGADSVTVHQQQPADDLLLELVNTGHPEWKWGRPWVEGPYTSPEATLHRPTVMSCDLPWWTSSCNNTQTQLAHKHEKARLGQGGFCCRCCKKLPECVFLISGDESQSFSRSASRVNEDAFYFSTVPTSSPLDQQVVRMTAGFVASHANIQSGEEGSAPVCLLNSGLYLHTARQWRESQSLCFNMFCFPKLYLHTLKFHHPG